MPVVEYTPAEIKRAVVGYGRAEKPQVQADGEAAARVSTRCPTPHDAADALAVAICHVHSHPASDRRLQARRANAAAAEPAQAPRRARSWRAVPPRRTMIALSARARARKAAQPRDRRRRRRRLRVAVPLSTFYAAGEPEREITLRIHTHVREDALRSRLRHARSSRTCSSG